MATYNELLAQYNALPMYGTHRSVFLDRHPKFKARLQAGGEAGSGKAATEEAEATSGQLTPGSVIDTSGPNWVRIPGTSYYYNANNGRVADASGVYVGRMSGANLQAGAGAISFFPGYAPSGGGGGAGQVVGEEPAEGEIPADAPPKPPAVPGYRWEWDEDSQSWTAVRVEPEVDVAAQGRLRAELRDILDQFGLATQGNIDLIERAVREDWSPTKFTQELRQSPDYLANPLFAANLERARAGNRFQTEGEIIAYASQARSLARRFGYQEPSDAYIAQGIRSGLSLAEQEHRYAVQDRVNQFGAGVTVAYREILGRDPSDQDLFEIFDPEISTGEIVDALRQAEYRGRPFSLGFGIRTEAEARAAEMLGVSPDEWFQRFQKAGEASPKIGRLAALDALGKDLPANFGQFLADARNQHLLAAFLMPGTPEGNAAMAEIQDMTARELARFRTGAAPVSAGGQAVGLLNPEQRASFG